MKRHKEMSENDNMIYQNFWDAAKVVIRGKFILLQANHKKQEKSQVNNLTLYHQELVKEKQKQPKLSRIKDIIKITAELNKMKKDYAKN